MTQGLYGALEEATGSEQANKEIAQIVVEQFGVQSTLTGVAQGVVDRIVRVHHDQYMQVDIQKEYCKKSCLKIFACFLGPESQDVLQARGYNAVAEKL